MASRSFKPASFLASAAAPNRSPRQRPQFTRSSSSSSVHSTKSEDSVVVTLKNLIMESSSAREEKEGDASAAYAGTQARAIDDTPGHKRSQPIAIEFPSRSIPKAYTPLSARGDLPGGYFPNHESPSTTHRSHPFASRTTYPDSPVMSTSSSLAASPASETTPKMPSHMVLTPTLLGQMSPIIPEPLLKPMGKYHPSNYKSPPTTGVSTPASTPPRSMPPTNLAIPNTALKRQNRERQLQSSHERKTSDVKRKLQQYQRDMIAQARISAATSIGGSVAGEKKKPISPRLLPAGSPGPITPLELEMDAEEGYIVAGGRARGVSLIGGGVERETGVQAKERSRSVD